MIDYISSLKEGIEKLNKVKCVYYIPRSRGNLLVPHNLINKAVDEAFQEQIIYDDR